ncbi:uncharacterized protein BO97DRAFT_473011 [Aspergillus homomorphus CBS 101889]|uniref:Rhodopsin domain-containing protein n=1 Tax=Aspergillus homomorphus (strain CBS 101889) TaxID=1450537 RepID=A0A395HM64_ASPHC|nr:hypothetical protein BO97DRAFT_473011 [Aspergillus homomorphus CBS 101889]RAL08513.1 hypothetical protein BO97DRAFT_473011 [Aspergillus homomorphus CBS 101889]
MADTTSTQYSTEYLNETQQPMLIAVTTVFVVLETVSLALRFVSKRIGGIHLGWDDALMVLGYVFCMGLNASCYDDTIRGGLGLHKAQVELTDPSKLIIWGHYIIVVPLVYFQGVNPPKLAIIYLYLHIFTSKRTRMLCYVVAAILVGNWLGTTVAGFLACRPLSYFWTHQGQCFNINAFFRWSGLANIITDCIMLVLPMPMVWQLQASLRLKSGIMLTFLLGSVGLFSSIFRFYEFFVTNAEVDETWSGTTFVIWCVIEAGVYQIAACFPSYRPLVKFIGRRVLKMTTRDSTADHSSVQKPSRALERKQFRSLTGEVTAADEEDGVGLVTLGNYRADIEPGTIMVDRKFSVS